MCVHVDTFKYVSYQKKLQTNFLCHVLILCKINYYKNPIVFYFVACNTWVFKLPGTLEVVILPTDVSTASKYKRSQIGVEYIRVKHGNLDTTPTSYVHSGHSIYIRVHRLFPKVFELSRVYTCVQ